MIGSIIADSATLGLSYVERLLKEVTPEKFARFALVGDTLVESNHPAFILGHLSIYPCRIVRDLEQEASAIEPTEKFEALFSPSAKCLDDPEGNLYPSMDEIKERFFTSHQLAIDVLRAAPDTLFDRPNPNERMQAKFPTIGAMHAFYLGGHVMLHVGQFSAWRRMSGLGPA